MSDRPNGLDRLLGYVSAHLPDESKNEPKRLTPEEIDRVRTELSNDLLAFAELMTPVFDHADGIRADLVRRRWSPQAAEQIALIWLVNTVQSIFGARA
ncbi:hypothetical protein AQJ11_02830 [Streptomyces corchorusii]|uniref:Uncharacterized protein n=2 Tax=Streptomyces TaxID=1883 RepID=A0A101QM89_STRCK|nr:hypothetical protein [Streptomyces corchorusii]KUN32476.1 hypothetical protein AQJ11_02830 [Streptomyces corchorusii]